MNQLFSLFTRVNQRGQQGFNLIEAAVILGIVGLVVGGIWIAAAAVKENRNISIAEDGVLQIDNAVYSLFHDLPWPYSVYTDMTPLFIASGKINSEFVSGAACMKDPWGGDVDVQAYGTEWVIYFRNISSRTCVNLVTRVSTRVPASGLPALTYIYIEPTGSLVSFPVSPSTALASCGHASFTGLVYFKFSLP